MKRIRRSAATLAALTTAAAGMFVASGVLTGSASAATLGHHHRTFLGSLHHVAVVGSTVPRNGDINPYGVAVVPSSTGRLHQGDVLVSNFNNRFNVQGTGTTIVQIHTHGHAHGHARDLWRGGHASVFADVRDRACPGGVGLTSALVVLRSGWVIVGSLPTRRGHVSGPGCLIVLDRWGHVRETIRGRGIDGPWGMTALDLSSGGRQAVSLGGGGGGVAVLFVTNVLGGILGHHHHHSMHGGTVLRLIITSDSHRAPRLLGATEIGSHFGARLDHNALVIGPTGVGLGGGTLYVADTLRNRIAAIPNAVFRHRDAHTGFTVTWDQWLRGPLGLAIAPNGNIITANGGDGNLVETTPHGRQVAVARVIRHGAGDLFGIAIRWDRPDGVYFVDDSIRANNLKLLF